MSDDLVYTEPAERAAPTGANGQGRDWSGWERWLQGHLAIARQAIVETIVEEINDLEANHDRRIRELELKIAECNGALNVLRTGKTLRVCGTYRQDGKYEQHDVVAYGGSSFVARQDNPGECPGPHWQLLCSCGRRGERGFTGPKGERGEPGDAALVPGFKAIQLDRQNYTISLATTDGQIHKLSLRGLFEQFLSECKEVDKWIPS